MDADGNAVTTGRDPDRYGESGRFENISTLRRCSLQNMRRATAIGRQSRVFPVVRHLCRSAHARSQNDRFGPNFADLS